MELVREGETRIMSTDNIVDVVIETPEEINALVSKPNAYALTITDNLTEEVRDKLQSIWRKMFDELGYIEPSGVSVWTAVAVIRVGEHELVGSVYTVNEIGIGFERR